MGKRRKLDDTAAFWPTTQGDDIGKDKTYSCKCLVVLQELKDKDQDLTKLNEAMSDLQLIHSQEQHKESSNCEAAARFSLAEAHQPAEPATPMLPDYQEPAQTDTPTSQQAPADPVPPMTAKSGSPSTNWVTTRRRQRAQKVIPH